MGWEEQSLPDLQEEPVNSLSGQEGNWQSHGDLAEGRTCISCSEAKEGGCKAGKEGNDFQRL